MWGVFADEYLPDPVRPWGRFGLLAHRNTSTVDEKDRISADVRVDGEIREIEGVGNGPISAFVDALDSLGVEVRVLDYTEHAMSAGSDARAAAYVECQVGETVLWGVGVDSNTITASLKAVLSAVNRVGR
jgi:2-isopropylmalate synthase